jgi:predicted dehydrogenase
VLNAIRFAIFGFGTIAKTHMTALRALPVIKKTPAVPVLDTLVTRNPEAHRQQAEAIGFRIVTASAEEAAADEAINVIDICTPNANHFEDAALAFRHGKSVYCEKPVTDTYERSKALLDVKAGYPAGLEQLAFTFRYHPAVMRIREWLKQGIIGDVLQCKISYRRSGYLNPARPVSWRLESGMSGGGAISDLGVHALDLVRHWFGELTEVSGQTNTFVGKRPSASDPSTIVEVDVDDWALMLFTTGSGVKGTVEMSRIAFGSDAFDIQIVGSKGSITCDLEKQAVPAVHLLSGAVPALPSPASLTLLPDEKATMGFAVDTHFAALHHFILRYADGDGFPGLAPSMDDGVNVEYWIDRVLKAGVNSRA